MVNTNDFLNGLIIAVWVITGISTLILGKCRYEHKLTVTDLITSILLGSSLGIFALLIYIIMSDLGDTVIWRKK